ncbi:hypothetical protein GS518_15250 [Leptospira interrogans]|uniref:Uncharacterized protein n=3 Tax=Leptospira interrogans TaxID=173 RepID=A0AAP9WHV5_LEPIR|nr:hypothetical protein A6J42_20930 [Leptospira interrogans serovar Copenhageni]KAA1268248.1 hypothetical protein C5473_09770 [Leptospira interrogans serovar Weerasinghe]KAA1291122.1 hypothetical protein C4X99_12735 [Leptospira interrogans serovar Geyaweera]MBE0302918.1 hypothetical protein [Leptospira interrogans serovar Yeoncheon]MBO8005128.1 hypothetical protein [Leptospira interrogans serovar Icterohaemorrhagiae]MBW9225439.1 hypothetical protein [Leptospira interrogans]QEI01824.1 hypothet
MIPYRNLKIKIIRVVEKSILHLFSISWKRSIEVVLLIELWSFSTILFYLDFLIQIINRKNINLG